jgi:ABC-2 type transport system ATP-binding protein
MRSARYRSARYVGRVGGLAVALGVGTTVFLGYGIASAAPAVADTASTADSTSPAPDPGPPSVANSGARDRAAGVKARLKASRTNLGSVAKPPVSATGAPGETPETSSRTAASDQQGTRSWVGPIRQSTRSGAKARTRRIDIDAVETEPPAETTRPPRPRVIPARPQAGDEPARETTPQKSVPAASAPSPVSPVSPASAVGTPPKSARIVDAAAVSRALGISADPVREPAKTSNPLIAIVADVLNSSLGQSPAAPAPDSPVAWTVLAAARREISSDKVSYAPQVGLNQGVITGYNPDIAPDGSVYSSRGLPVTFTVVGTSGAGGKVLVDKTTGDFTFLPFGTQPAPGGAEQFNDTEQFRVLVAETTPLVQALEGIAIVGDVVTPIVVQLHQIPILNEALAPVIGYSKVQTVTVLPAALAASAPGPIAFTTTVTSFDGTPISVNYFPAVAVSLGDQAQAPTILNGPSLATAGYTDSEQETTVFGLVPGLQPLRAAGYNVVTWDPRGEFASGGVLQLDSPEYEARDVSAIIDWVSLQPQTRFDTGLTGAPVTKDPLIGMVGGSYGGGIQLTTAGTDPRIDAISPGIAWYSLNTALYPNDAFKTSFSSLLLLSLVVSGARINPQIYSGIATGVLLGFLTQNQQDFLSGASPDLVVGDISAPTLLLQGTVDVLFPLEQAVRNAEAISPGTPVNMVWYCGGHGQCLDPVDADKQTAFLTGATLDWLDRYVMDEGQAPPDEPNFQWVDQKGNLYSSQYLPTDDSALYTDSAPITVTGAGGGTLAIVPVIGGSGPQTLASFPVSLGLGAKAKDAINVTVTAPPPPADPESDDPEPGDPVAYVVGAPEVTLHYSGIGTATHVYAQLVDNATGRVVGNIVSPIPVVLDGKPQSVTVPMEDIAYTVGPNDSLTLQIVGSATAYEDFTAFGVIDVSGVDVTLPTANPANVEFEQSFTTTQPASPSRRLLGI